MAFRRTRAVETSPELMAIPNLEAVLNRTGFRFTYKADQWDREGRSLKRLIEKHDLDAFYLWHSEGTGEAVKDLLDLDFVYHMMEFKGRNGVPFVRFYVFRTVGTMIGSIHRVLAESVIES